MYESMIYIDHNFLGYYPCRYADVGQDGKYQTSIQSDGARFSVALGALLGTRIALCFQAIAASKVGTMTGNDVSYKKEEAGCTGQHYFLSLHGAIHAGDK